MCRTVRQCKKKHREKGSDECADLNQSLMLHRGKCETDTLATIHGTKAITILFGCQFIGFNEPVDRRTRILILNPVLSNRDSCYSRRRAMTQTRFPNHALLVAQRDHGVDSHRGRAGM